MITVPELAADTLGSFIADFMEQRFGSSDRGLVELVPSVARVSLECIGNSDALYHNVEHTMLVTLAGHEIMRGRAMHARLLVTDYAHVIVSCLTHDIGYVRGILSGDDEDGYVINAAGEKIKLPRGASDAALMAHHVDRSKLYIMERIQGSPLLDATRIARAVEGTRFPTTMPAEVEDIDEEAALLRAADLIGQLGDPNYIRKSNALYFEFQEVGLNGQLGYESPADLVLKYPQFYWNCVAPYVQTAIKYLNVTATGRQWVSNLYSNVFRAERDIALSGPQK
jgi:hypothetical protein